MVSPLYHHTGRTRKNLNYCFQYSISGEGVLRYGSQLYKLKPGTAFFSRISDPSLEYYYPEDATEPWQFFWCGLEGEALYSMASEICDQFGHFYEIPFDEPVIQDLYKLTKPTLHTLNMTCQENAGLATSLLAKLTIYGQKLSSVSKDSVLDRSLQFIQHHIDKNINASDVAKGSGVSREYLSRLFKKNLNQSPYQIIRQQKLNLASSYLKGSNLPVYEVAKLVGIPPHQFSAWFKQQTGSTPKAFRLQ